MVQTAFVGMEFASGQAGVGACPCPLDQLLVRDDGHRVRSMMRLLTLSPPFASHKSRPTAHKKTKHLAEGSGEALAALIQEIIDADEGALAARPRRSSGQPLKSRRTMALRRSAGFGSWLSASRSTAEVLRSRPSGTRAAIHNMPFSSTTRCVSHGRPLRLSPSHLSVNYLPFDLAVGSASIHEDPHR